jgi:hypothetical protein
MIVEGYAGFRNSSRNRVQSLSEANSPPREEYLYPAGWANNSKEL